MTPTTLIDARDLAVRPLECLGRQLFDPIAAAAHIRLQRGARVG